MFRLNYRMIINQFRIESFCAKIRERMGTLPAAIAKAMMNRSTIFGKAMVVGSTEQLRVQEIIALLPSGEGKTIDFAKMTQVLEEMATDQ